MQVPVDGYWLTVGVLGVWRVTHLLHAEDGPGRIIVRLRQGVGDGVLGQAMDCFKCLSLWVAAPFAVLLGHGNVERGLLWLALSAAAIVIEGAVRRLMPAEVTWAEDPVPEPISRTENDDVQLWKRETHRGRSHAHQIDDQLVS